MISPLVSILVPVYNGERFLKECLESIVNQIYQNLQVVIVDDGSTDRTAEILDRYAIEYPYIEVYHIPNGGVANARNLLLDKVKGEYVLFVDADDMIEPDMVSEMVRMAGTENLDVTVCGKRIKKEVVLRRTESKEMAQITKRWDRSQALRKFLRHEELNGSLWNKLIRSELLRNVRFSPEISYGEDALVVWEILRNVNRVGVTSYPFYHHRINEDSISHGKFGPKLMSGHFVWQKFVSDSKQSYPHLVSLAEANSGVADFWLLYFAALDRYPHNEHISEYRRNLRSQLPEIRRQRLLTIPKYMVAAGLAYCYPLAGMLLRGLRKK